MAKKITLTEYLHDLEEYHEGVSLEARVLTINSQSVVLRPELLFGGQVIWKGMEFEVGVEETLAMHQFTMTDNYQLLSWEPVDLGEHYEQDEAMQ